MIGGAFATGAIQDTYATYAAMVEPYATTEVPGRTFLNNAGDFPAAVAELNAHAAARATAVGTYLSR